MKLQIKKNVSDKNWNHVIRNIQRANIFQTPEMYQVYKNTKNYEPVFLSVVNDDNEILGILLAVIQKEHSGLLGNFSAHSIISGIPCNVRQ